MSEITHSTLTSPRSPLFSDSDPPELQSGSEIVTSDEEPDLGAFTEVLRAWGHLQPPLRIPTYFQSSSSSRTRSTPTTITGYPGFGGGDSETVEEDTVWNRIPIQTYLHSSSRGTTTTSSTNRTERARGFLGADGSYFSPSPPPSPTSEGARTVEIASETDGASLHEFVSYEDGTSGERLVVLVATPTSVDARTVSVASAVESHDGQTQLSPRLSIQISASPLFYGPHMPVINDISASSVSSISSLSSHSHSTSNHPLDDNSTISRSRPYSSALSILSYQPQISTNRTRSSVFQESPSPALASHIPFQEPQTTTTTSSSSTIPIALSRSTMGRTVSDFSHAESDIINSYYAQRPSESSSADQPALESPWTRRLEILALPPPTSQLRPLVEQDSPSEHRQTPSVVDDNSSMSAMPETTPPPSATTSAAFSVLHEITAVNSESSSSHSLTPSHTFAPPTVAPTAATTQQPSLEASIVRPHPSLSSTYREEQTRARVRLDPSTFYEMQQESSQPRYHLLSPERDPDYEHPSLGYLDEALSFIAAERVRWTAAREAGLQRGNTPQGGDEDQGGEAGAEEGATWRYATESRTKKSRKQQTRTSTLIPTAPSSVNNESLSSGTDILTSNEPISSSNGYTPSSNIVILNSPSRKKGKGKNRIKYISANGNIKPISILKRPDPNGASSSLLPGAHLRAAMGASLMPKYDGSATPRANHYLHSSSSDNQAIEDGGVDQEEEEEVYESEKRGLRLKASHSYIHRQNPRGEGTSSAVYNSIPNTPHHRGEDNRSTENEEGSDTRDTSDSRGLSGGGILDGEEKGVDSVDKQKKGKGKKKARTKRKLPVTTLIPISATLSQSRSAPDLRGDVRIENTAKEDWEPDSSGMDIPGITIVPAVEKKGKRAVKLFSQRKNPAATLFLPFCADSRYVQSKRARLVALARHLQTLFPEEQEQLRKVIGKLDGHPPVKNEAGPSSSKKKRGKAFIDDCSFDYSSLGDSDLLREEHEEVDPDPRGEAPGEKDTLVHVFIDHSNILIGLLSYIKRSLRKPRPSLTLKSTTTQPAAGTSTIAITSSRPLPVPKMKAGVLIPDIRPLIPLPSFATAYGHVSSLSRSAPSTSTINSLLATRRKDPNSDGDEYDQSGYDDDQEERPPMSKFEDEGYEPTRSVKSKVVKAKKRVPRHLWHAALALILERGRPITRRAVAASSPLHQPMDDIQTLGYEVNIYMRVPDLGDGADRQDKSTKYDHSKDSGGSPSKRPSSPARTTGSGNLGGASTSRNKLDPSSSKKGHVRRVSDNPSGNVGSLSSTSGQQTTRVKYREQGVDELLQLKLYHVINATDNVPEGATIILATGDGNVGQFNEFGFLGPVRTALMHGWRVELYAWEDGLSRAWLREFGPNSEWGRKGMFRIIGMEQFAEYLVEDAGWQHLL